MNKKDVLLHPIISITGFLIVALFSMFSLHFKINLVIKLCFGIIPVVITIVFCFHNFSLFVPSLFFSLTYLASPFIVLILAQYEIQLYQIIFLPIIILYIVIICFNKKLKNEVSWLNPGKIDVVTFVVMLITIFGSGLSLLLWAVVVKKDISEFFKFIPQVPLPLLFVYGFIVFPLFNALFEEFLARGVLYDGLKKAVQNDNIVILIQAIIFGIWHYNGFPGGVIGVIMVCIWSCLLGFIRSRSKGMLAPVIAHYFADLCIAITIYVFYLTM